MTKIFYSHRLANSIMTAILFICLHFVFISFSLASSGEEKKGSNSGELPEWVFIQGQIAALKAKINGHEKAMKDLIDQKSSLKDTSKKEEVMQLLKKEHSAYRKTIEDYHKQVNLLKYRFPEVGLKEKEKYIRYDDKTLEEYETEVTLETKIKKSVKLIKRQFGVQADSKKDAAKKNSENSQDQKNLHNHQHGHGASNKSGHESNRDSKQGEEVMQTQSGHGTNSDSKKSNAGEDSSSTDSIEAPVMSK